jgi:crossover junction endodeoxyribonuclease RuvC
MMGATIYIGVDPGMKGALAFYDPVANDLDVYAMPTFHRTRTSGRGLNVLDLIQLARIIDNQIGWDRKASVWIEMVHSKPGEGVSSAFNFGFGTGALHGLFAAHFLPIQIIAPVKWKRALACPADKDAARERASQLFPRHAQNWPLAKDDGKAEAALIALYGSKNDVRA